MSWSWPRNRSDNRKKAQTYLPLALIVFYGVLVPLPAADWPTFGHDPQRSGWAFEETTLTPENVVGLDLRWKVHLANEAKSLTSLMPPVVATKVVTTRGIKTVIYTAGSSSNFFALDAETGDTLWSQAFQLHVLPKDRGFWLCSNGVNATPTIDRSTNSVFTIAADGRLYGLDLGTGEVRFGPVQFVPAFSKSWSLNLVDGTIYTSLTEGCGGGKGGLYAMDIRDPLHTVIHELRTSHRGAGVWGRGGPVIGKNGLVYGATADGSFNPSIGDFADSFVAASPRDLEIVDFYAPANWSHIEKYDLDIGSAGPVYFEREGYNLLAGGGKEGYLYLLDADSLGNKDHQTPLFVSRRLANDGDTYELNGIWESLSAWKDTQGETWLFVPIWGRQSKEAPKFPSTNGPIVHGSIAAFKVSSDSVSGKPTLEPAWLSGDINLPEPVVIANGIAFVLSTGENARQTHEGGHIFEKFTLLTDAEKMQNTQHAVLYALDAKTGRVLYQSGDVMPGWVHFSGLAVANGQIFAVDHDSWVYCFGLKARAN